jgi:ferritin-like metal-binding protein YciE
VSAFAEELGEPEQVSLLNQTLEEEEETDEKLTELAAAINAQANRDEEAGEEDEKPVAKKKPRNAA